MKTECIAKRLERLLRYCYRVRSRHCEAPRWEPQILSEYCTRIRLIIDRLRNRVPATLRPLPCAATDPCCDLSNIIEWTNKILRSKGRYEGVRGHEGPESCPPELSWEKRAKSLMNGHPNWRHTTIARQLGAHQSTLIRSKLFAKAMEAKLGGQNVPLSEIEQADIIDNANSQMPNSDTQDLSGGKSRE